MPSVCFLKASSLYEKIICLSKLRKTGDQYGGPLFSGNEGSQGRLY